MKKPCCMATHKKNVLKRFEKRDQDKHTNYRTIAYTLAYDYHKQTIKIYELEQKIEQLKELKEDRKIVYNLISELYEYIQNGMYFWDIIENENLLEKLATMQNYCN